MIKKPYFSRHLKDRFVSIIFANLIAIAAIGCASSDSGIDVDIPDDLGTSNSSPVVSSDPLVQATVGAEYSYTLTATDSDGDSLTMSATSIPDWLSFTAGSGVLSGTPQEADIGDHAVTLTVSDGTATVTQAFTVSVEASNSAPAFSSDPVTTAEEAVEYSYTATATDQDQDTLTFAATVLPSWLSFDADNAVLSGTPQSADVGDHSVTLTVSDGTDTVEQSFVVSVAEAVEENVAPVITSTAITSATVDQLFSYELTATDENGDELTMVGVVVPSWLSFNATTGILSGTPVSEDVGSHAVTLQVTDGFLETNQSFEVAVTEPAAAALVIFEDAENPLWQAWDCCGGSTPTIETDDAEYGNTVEFSIGATATVMGFTSRVGHGVTDGVPFDATDIVDDGTFSFDLKLMSSPGDTDWKFKIESDEAATAVEVSLSTSNEGHSAPVVGEWQRYTFNLSALQTAGLDVSKIDVVMVFPAWDTGNGAVYRLDNVKFLADGGEPEDPVDPPVASNLVIFEEAFNPLWPAWDCCGGSTPTVEADDAEYGNTVEFSIGATATVMGFTSRPGHGVTDGVPFNASAIVDAGIISFDLKMTSSPGDTDWKFKIESDEATTAVEVSLSASNEGHTAPVLNTWQHYTFNLSDLQSDGLDVSKIDVIMIFPAWDTGNGAVYRVDNVNFFAEGAVDNGSQVDLPITFDQVGVDYTVLDFGGNVSVLAANPEDAEDQVVMTTKTDSAETWAGTTMSTDDGLATAVPLTLSDSIMKVWVYSPDAGIPVRLKLENHLDPTQTVETEAMTTVANGWQQLTFDFTNEAAGTEPLNPTLHPDWIFDKASIFFNFGTDGATAGEKVYYFDDVTFGDG
jgi:hypothetical protein